MKASSMRWSLLLWFGALLALVLVIFNFAAWSLARAGAVRELDAVLQSRASAMSDAWRGAGRGPGGKPGPAPGRIEEHEFGGPHGFPPDRDGPHFEDRKGGPEGGRKDGPLGERHKGPDFHPEAGMSEREDRRRLSDEVAAQFTNASQDQFFIIWSRLGPELQRSAGAPAVTWSKELARRGETIFRDAGGWRQCVHVTEQGDVLMVGASLSALEQHLFSVGWKVALASLAFQVVALGGAWLLIRRALAPIGEISRAARQISEGDLQQRISGLPVGNELAELAKVLNETFARLEGSFRELQQFTADAAHELRTPLAVMITEAQTALSRTRSEAEYQETIHTCLAAAQEMRELVESLLLLARLDGTQGDIPRETCELDGLAREVIKLFQLQARERRVEVMSSLSGGMVYGVSGQLRRVLINLVDNAIYYNRAQGEVWISTRQEGADVVLEVEDSGIGIAATELPFIFQRFYRVDKARTGGGGRSGLGLAIVKAVVEAHGGEITVRSELGQGTVFRVRLPAAK